MSKKSKAELNQKYVLYESKFCPSSFTLTFVIEVVGFDVWHDCNEGWVDLGPPAGGAKLSYQLYPGQTFDIDVVLWRHVAKVLCGTNYGWVRTWQFLERRWVTFSIRHAFAVRVADLRNIEVILTPNFGISALSANTKTMTTTEVLLSPLQFGERRQFAKVVEAECPTKKYIEDMIWFLVVDRIPTSVLDGPFDTPFPVQDIRHQDAALYEVRNAVLNRPKPEQDEVEEKENIAVVSHRQLQGKEPPKKPIVEKKPYEIKLPGDWILAGIGRVTPFVVTGDRPKGQGEVLAVISSINLPAPDDFSIFFVNVCNLTEVPVEHLKLHRFTHIYTRWTMSGEEHNSEQELLQTNQVTTDINFNDHHSVPLPNAMVSDLMASFYDEPFQLELRGIRIPPPVSAKPSFFGYEKTDRDFGSQVPPIIPKQDKDILIAQTRIDAKALTRINGSVKGEFPLYPPEKSVMKLEREEICTNDVNAIRAKVKPDLIIQPGVILQAQMTIEVSLGVVGCIPQTMAVRYSRMYCLINDSNVTMKLLREITEINKSVTQTESKAGLLTGFLLDTGDTVMLYVEGPKDGHILHFWEKTEEFFPIVKPIFSTSDQYSCRLYPDLLLATMPFNVMKMAVPLSVLLSMPPIYARPALPLPTRSAVLKIGRLIASKLESVPCSRVMPTSAELKSFRLELCVPPRPPAGFDQPCAPHPSPSSILSLFSETD
ncbi:hypothetical protein PYW08_003279 [Mythimna loreyi]|uniref:Uncharacterized protein n=1 Tax=Mythimna loreyi TaxID=667449 RepID=A0ACC2QQN1_9NEOP|nr:hypothetical protein PYW08_003279 [Mythimna loreyi]